MSLNLKSAHPVLIVAVSYLVLIAGSHLLLHRFHNIHLERGLFVIALTVSLFLLKLSQDRSSTMAFILVVLYLGLMIVGFVEYGQLSPAWAAIKGGRFLLGDF